MNIGRYLRGEDRHVGTARTTRKKNVDDSQDIYNDLWTKIHDLVDSELADCDEKTEELIRQKLTETFRFWKRSA